MSYYIAKPISGAFDDAMACVGNPALEETARAVKAALTRIIEAL
ncbi:MAG: hypothetical protein AAB227_01180 [Pseudomonadota bacterium]